PRTEFTSFQRKLYHSLVARRIRLPVSSMRNSPWSLTTSITDSFVARSRVTRQLWSPGETSATSSGSAASGSPNSCRCLSSSRRGRTGSSSELLPVVRVTVAASGAGQISGQYEVETDSRSRCPAGKVCAIPFNGTWTRYVCPGTSGCGSALPSRSEELCGSATSLVRPCSARPEARLVRLEVPGRLVLVAVQELRRRDAPLAVQQLAVLRGEVELGGTHRIGVDEDRARHGVGG